MGSNVVSTGTVIDDTAKDLLGQGRELKETRPRKEDIVQE